MKQGIDLRHIDPRLRTMDRSLPGVSKPQNVADVVVKKRLGEQIISRVETLPALPTIVTQLMQLIDDDRSSVKNLETYLRQDQALTARLLKIVNSSFFGLRNKISSIPQAIVIIGYNSLKNLVLAASTSKLFQGSCPAYGYKENGLWQHSFMSAEWAKKIGLKLGFDIQSAEEMFVAGLLHDVGKLILANYVNTDCKEMIKTIVESQGNIIVAEETTFGLDHARIGSKVAQKWNFSKKLAAIIEFHHRPKTASLYAKETALIHLVNYLLSDGHYGMYENFPLKNDLCIDSVGMLGVTDEMIEEFRTQISESAAKWDEGVCLG
ncbi:MAG: HDOD domain-containing protein [Candidatus Auribacterota bacterium]